MTLDLITFCDKDNESVSQGIKKIKRELNQQLNDNEKEKIIWALQKNDELNKKHLESKKEVNYLKYKPKTQKTFERNEPSNQTERPPSEHQKALYSLLINGKARQIFDENLANKTLLVMMTTRLNKHYWMPVAFKAEVETGHLRYLNK